MKRGLRRALLGLLAAVLLVPVWLLAQFWLLGPARNDRAARRLERELTQRLALAEGETLVETASWCGNSGGTGNHTELWAGALVYCAAPGEETLGVPLDRDAPGWGRGRNPSWEELEELFPTLGAADSWEGYYLRETYGRAATQWDNRGC